MSNTAHTPPAETVAAVARYEAARNAEVMAATVLEEALIDHDYTPNRFDNVLIFTYVNGWGLERTVRLTVAAEVVR